MTNGANPGEIWECIEDGRLYRVCEIGKHEPEWREQMFVLESIDEQRGDFLGFPYPYRTARMVDKCDVPRQFRRVAE